MKTLMFKVSDNGIEYAVWRVTNMFLVELNGRTVFSDKNYETAREKVIGML